MSPYVLSGARQQASSANVNQTINGVSVTLPASAMVTIQCYHRSLASEYPWTPNDLQCPGFVEIDARQHTWMDPA